MLLRYMLSIQILLLNIQIIYELFQNEKKMLQEHYTYNF